MQGAVLGFPVALQPPQGHVHIGDVGHPAEKEDQGDGRQALSVAQVQPVLAVWGLVALHGPVELADDLHLLPGDPQHPSRHPGDEDDGREQDAVHLQVDVGHGEDLLVGAHFVVGQRVCRTPGRPRGVVEGAVGGVVVPLIPAKGGQGGIEQGGHPHCQQRHREAAVDPELVVVQGADDTQVTLVMHHHQVEEIGQEKEVGEGVDQEARLEVQALLKAHARDEGQSDARAQVSHQQAQEEVVGRVVELSVADNAHDDDQVGQDDGWGQRDCDAGDEPLFLLEMIIIAIHGQTPHVFSSVMLWVVWSAMKAAM